MIALFVAYLCYLVIQFNLNNYILYYAFWILIKLNIDWFDDSVDIGL